MKESNRATDVVYRSNPIMADYFAGTTAVAFITVTDDLLTWESTASAAGPAVTYLVCVCVCWLHFQNRSGLCSVPSNVHIADSYDRGYAIRGHTLPTPKRYTKYAETILHGYTKNYDRNKKLTRAAICVFLLTQTETSVPPLLFLYSPR